MVVRKIKDNTPELYKALRRVQEIVGDLSHDMQRDQVNRPGTTPAPERLEHYLRELDGLKRAVENVQKIVSDASG